MKETNVMNLYTSKDFHQSGKFIEYQKYLLLILLSPGNQNTRKKTQRETETHLKYYAVTRIIIVKLNHIKNIFDKIIVNTFKKFKTNSFSSS